MQLWRSGREARLFMWLFRCFWIGYSRQFNNISIQKFGSSYNTAHLPMDRKAENSGGVQANAGRRHEVTDNAGFGHCENKTLR